jgi:hypothetical protein
VTNFIYLGSILSRHGDLDDEVEKRIQAEWMKWKTLSGVQCEKRLQCLEYNVKRDILKELKERFSKLP